MRQKVADKERPEVLERLRSAIAKSGGVAAISLKTKIKERTLSRYLAAGSRIPAEAMFEISRATNASLEWLMGGGSSANIGSVAHSSAYSILIPMLNVQGSSGPGVSSGFVEVVDRLPFSAAMLKEMGVRPENAHFIVARGDSMEPTIRDGAVVLVDVGRRKSRDDGIYVLTVGDDVRLKRLQFGLNSLTLISDNADRYPREVLTAGDLDQVRIEGKIFWAGGVL